jgi:hypothetical protein
MSAEWPRAYWVWIQILRSSHPCLKHRQGIWQMHYRERSTRTSCRSRTESLGRYLWRNPSAEFVRRPSMSCKQTTSGRHKAGKPNKKLSHAIPWQPARAETSPSAPPAWLAAFCCLGAPTAFRGLLSSLLSSWSDCLVQNYELKMLSKD